MEELSKDKKDAILSEMRNSWLSNNKPDEDDRDELLDDLEASGDYDVKVYNTTRLSEDMVQKFMRGADYIDISEADGETFLKTFKLKPGATKSDVDVIEATIILPSSEHFKVKIETPKLKYGGGIHVPRGEVEELSVKLVGTYNPAIFESFNSFTLVSDYYLLDFKTFKYFNGVLSSVDFDFN